MFNIYILSVATLVLKYPSLRVETVTGQHTKFEIFAIWFIICKSLLFPDGDDLGITSCVGKENWGEEN